MRPSPTSACSLPVAGLDDLALLGVGDLNPLETGTQWLWHGFLAPGNVTVLTSQWKAGKTTLLSALLRKLKVGGTFVGQPVLPGKAVIISEESPTLWYERDRVFEFGNKVGWLCRPFRAKPTPEQWSLLVDRIVAWHQEQPRDLVVIDPLAPFLPGSENCASTMLSAMLPLQRLTTAGLAVLILHHSQKNVTRDGQAARGSGVLAGFADILIEMYWYRRAADEDRRRRLQTYSRYPQTPRQIIIELDAAGTDYHLVGNEGDTSFADTWNLIHAVLVDAPRKMSRSDIRQAWPEDGEPPDSISLWRWLNRAVEAGLVLRDGKGLKNDPYRYWLPISEARWRRDPLHLPDLPSLRDQFADARCPQRRSEIEATALREAARVLRRFQTPE